LPPPVVYWAEKRRVVLAPLEVFRVDLLSSVLIVEKRYFDSRIMLNRSCFLAGLHRRCDWLKGNEAAH
jgi:hypothetical protein